MKIKHLISTALLAFIINTAAFPEDKPIIPATENAAAEVNKAQINVQSDPTQCSISLQEFPDFVYRDDVRKFAVKLSRPFTFSTTNAKTNIKLSCKTTGSLWEYTLSLPAQKNAVFTQIVPLEFSNVPGKSVISLTASDTSTPSIFSSESLIVLDLAEGKKASEKITLDKNGIFRLEGKKVIFMLPRPDETANRRWQVIRELKKIPGMFKPSLLVISGTYANNQCLAPLKKHFSCLIQGTHSGAKEIFLQLLRNDKHDDISSLLVFLSDYDLINGTPITAYRQAVDAICALAVNRQLKCYITPPPPYPANPGLREHYLRNTHEAAEERFAHFADPFSKDLTFSGEYPDKQILQEAGNTLNSMIYIGPGWQALLPLPLVIISAAFWWLRIYSRFKHK